MSAAFEINEDRLSINVPAGQFTDTLIDGWKVTPNSTEAGRLHVVPWSEERIATYHSRMRRHRRYGVRLRRFYRWLDPTEGRWIDDEDADEDEDDRGPSRRIRFARWLDRRFVIHAPADRSKTLMNCMVLDGAPSAIHIDTT